jgi:hypothetical protein
MGKTWSDRSKGRRKSWKTPKGITERDIRAKRKKKRDKQTRHREYLDAATTYTESS